MACALAGAVASVRNDETGLGREFVEGLRAIGTIFIPVAGVMASLPFLSQAIRSLVGPGFAWLGADPAMAATSLIAVDMGGYQLAKTLAAGEASWIVATITGYMAGATIVFSIPVGLALLEKRDHAYFALGAMAGLLSIPIGVLTSCSILMLFPPELRSEVTTAGPSNHRLVLGFRTVLADLAPLTAFVFLLAAGLRRFPQQMIRGFMLFGRFIDGAAKLILAACIVEYFTGAFSTVFGSWGFDPIIADAKDPFRALEMAGYIGIMLAGAFPMVFLLTHFLSAPMARLGKRLGLAPAGAAGLLAAMANILAMFRLVREMPPRDKVLNIAFATCAAFMFGDHLAFTANFQPNLILPVLVGKFAGGVFAFALARRLSIPSPTEPPCPIS